MQGLRVGAVSVSAKPSLVCCCAARFLVGLGGRAGATEGCPDSKQPLPAAACWRVPPQPPWRQAPAALRAHHSSGVNVIQRALPMASVPLFRVRL